MTGRIILWKVNYAPPATRRIKTNIRARALADELGIPVRRVIDIALDQFDWYMDSTTRIPSDKADVIRTKVTGKPPAPSPDLPVATRPGPRPIPDNLPRLLALATASPQPRPRNRTPWVRIDDLPPLERLFARRYVEEEPRVSWKPNDPNRIPPDVHARVQNSARMWGEKWLDDRQTANWLNIGVIDPLTAAECREAGITPQMLQLPFAIPGKALHGGRLTLKKALDAKAATVEEIRADLVRTGVLPGHAQAS